MTGMDGDGTVPRLSATPIERSQAKAERIVACPHAGLPNFQPVRVQLRSALNDREISVRKTPGAEAISLKMVDIFSSGEPFRDLSRCAEVIDPMQATLVNIETGTQVEREFEMKLGSERW